MADLGPVARVADVGEVLVGRRQPQRRLVPQLVENLPHQSRMTGEIPGSGAKDRHRHAPRVRAGDEAPRLREVGCGPRPASAGACGVGAVGPVAGEVGRQDLAGDLGEAVPAMDGDGGPAVDGEVQRAARVEAVERRNARVEEHEVGEGLHVGVQLSGVPRHDRVELRPRRAAEGHGAHEVRTPALDRTDRLAPIDVEGEVDLVGIAGWPAVGRAKPRVAHQSQVLAIELRDLVRAGGRQRLAEGGHAGARRDRDGERLCQLVEEVGVGRSQAEGDRAGSVVDPDARGQVTVRVPRCARLGSADPAVEPLGRDALSHRHARAGAGSPRRAPAPPSSSLIPCRSWKAYVRPRSVGAGSDTARSGTSGRSLPPADAPEGDETVVDQAEDVCRLRCEDGGGVQPAPGEEHLSLGLRDPQGPAAMLRPGRAYSHPQRSVHDREALRRVADRQRRATTAGAPDRCGRPFLRPRC